MMTATRIYLDYNATAPLRPEVVRCMIALLAEPHNASSGHSWGREGKRIIENARKLVASAISAFPNEVVFTASGTEANNLALKGVKGHRLLLSEVEHASVLNVVPEAERLPVNNRGLVDMQALEAALRRSEVPVLCSVQLANNETGIIQPVEEVSRLVHAHGGLVHCDAAQALGKIPVDFGKLGVDMLTLSAHKFGGPQGAGALAVRDNLALQPLIMGGGQELRRRAGTENIAAIAGFAQAVDSISDLSPVRKWMDALESALTNVSRETIIVGSDVLRLPNTSCVTMPGIANETQLMHFDLNGIAVSAGSACSSGRVEPSHVLEAMRVPKEAASGAIRISAGWNTQESDLKAFVECWKSLYERAGARRAAGAG